VTQDPFTILGVDETAGDAEIRRRYLALVREYPPDRAPQRFQAIRAAYEALGDERKRLEMQLLRTNSAALARLNLRALQAGAATPGRATRQTIAALLAEGIMHSATNMRHSEEDSGGP
jgi:curved DNA-binding protein CbpA